MKTKFILCFTGFAMTFNSFSQIKVFSGGSVTIGATTSPTANAVMHQIIGGTTAFPGTTSSATSAPLIVGQNAVSSSPGFAFLGDYQTGIAHPASSVLAITIANSEKFRFNSTGQILSKSSLGASTPDFSWDSDANTGIFRPANDVLGFSTGGSEKARFNSAGHLLIGTTTDNAMISTYSSDVNAGYFQVNHTNDWWGTFTIETNQHNSLNYQVKYNGALKFYVAGDGWLYANGTYLGSDKNIKDDIKNIDSALNKVMQLNGVTFKLKKETQNPGSYPTPNVYMGVIAQDVEKVAPQAVKTVHDGTKAVSYEMLVGLLIEALKEQNAKVNQLESDVNNCCAKATPQNNRTITIPENNTNESYTGNSFIKQNAPNPFSKETIIEYYIAEKNAASSILVFDMNGKLLKTFKVEVTGKSSLTINGNDLQPGMYYYSLIINAKEVGTKKMILTEQ